MNSPKIVGVVEAMRIPLSVAKGQLGISDFNINGVRRDGSDGTPCRYTYKSETIEKVKGRATS